jgi:HEAT repeat protein
MSQQKHTFAHTHLSEALASPSVEQCVKTLQGIASSGHAEGLSAQIVSLAGSSDDDVRTWAADALESSVVVHRDEVPALIQLLAETSDSEVSYWAATLLGRLGRDAAAAVPCLENCLSRSMYLPARERAAWALCRIGAAAAPAMPSLRSAAIDGPPRLKRLAIEALEAIRGAAA